jgi:ATP-dependent Lon protease
MGNRQLPLLVTRGLVVFPESIIQIDVGRPFSINATIAAGGMYDNEILVTMQKDFDTETPGENGLNQVGCLCKIITTINTNSSIKVKLSSVERVNIVKIQAPDENTKYFLGDFEVVKSVVSDPLEADQIVKEISKILKALAASFRFQREKTTAYNDILKSNSSQSRFADQVAAISAVFPGDAQQYLEIFDVNARLKKLLESLRKEKEILDIDNKIDKNVNDEMRKNQNDYILREKLKAIKKELGENDGDDSNESILDKLDKNPYPEHVKNKVKSELKRFDMMPQSSLEASLIKNYIDLVMAVPWYQKTEDNDDIANIKKILDEDHYGLDKVKKRIIEYIAVKSMTKSLDAPILCFYGPPGVGKTSLAKSIARALGRKFFKASLGGISDESEIRGHRRTYVGSMPGRIISGMKKCGTINPVYLLD